MSLELWNQVKSVPETAQKPIQGGRLKGMTDISPIWRYQILTEHFGPCGIGWKYTIDKLWTETGNGVAVCAFAQVTLYIKDKDKWSDGIPGIGGSMLMAVERDGPHTSDECYKMAVTDALSVACKVLGIGADVYWSQGSKYSSTSSPDNVTPVQPAATKFPPKAGAPPALKDDLWRKCLDAARGDSKVAEGVLKLCSVFTDKQGKEQFLTLEKLATASEKYVSSTLRNFANKKNELTDFAEGSIPF